MMSLSLVTLFPMRYLSKGPGQKSVGCVGWNCHLHPTRQQRRVQRWWWWWRRRRQRQRQSTTINTQRADESYYRPLIGKISVCRSSSNTGSRFRVTTKNTTQAALWLCNKTPACIGLQCCNLKFSPSTMRRYSETKHPRLQTIAFNAHQLTWHLWVIQQMCDKKQQL